MEYKVIINNGWSKYTFYYTKESTALGVYNFARLDGNEAEIYLRAEKRWERIA